MSLGQTNSRFALNVRDDGYVVATVGGTQHVSDRPMPKDEWTFVALSYKASTMTFDMEASADQAGNVMLFEDRPVELKDLEAFSYTDDYHLYLGGIVLSRLLCLVTAAYHHGSCHHCEKYFFHCSYLFYY